jgi:hypothetical protein
VDGYCCDGTCRPFGQACCNGARANLLTDPSTCGTRGSFCPPELCGKVFTCSSGYCLESCGLGMGFCGGQRIDIWRDPNNCGGCGRVCDFSHGTGICQLGVCKIISRGAGYTASTRGSRSWCAATATDPNSCGACGNVCPCQSHGAICVNGHCCIGNGGDCGGDVSCHLGCCNGNNCTASGGGIVKTC